MAEQNKKKDNEKAKKDNKPKKHTKINQKTKNGLIFGGLAIVLIVATVIIANNLSNNKIKFVTNYGEIETSIILDTKKLEAVIDVDVQGQKVSQKCTYKCLDEPVSSTNDDKTTNMDGQYELYLDNGDVIKMSIAQDELTLVYDDATTIKYHKE